MDFHQHSTLSYIIHSMKKKRSSTEVYNSKILNQKANIWNAYLITTFAGLQLLIRPVHLFRAERTPHLSVAHHVSNTPSKKIKKYQLTHQNSTELHLLLHIHTHTEKLIRTHLYLQFYINLN